MKHTSRSGFSLIEVLIALSLMVFLSFMAMKIMDEQNSNKILLEDNFESTDFANTVRSILANNKSCKATFINTLLVENSSISKIIQNRKDPITSNYHDYSFIEINNNISQRLKLSSLKLINVDNIKKFATLEIVTENFKSKKFKKTILLNITTSPTNPNIISDCVTMGNIPVEPIELCNYTGGSYNSTTGKCQIKVDLDTGLLPSYCPPGSQILFETINDKPRVKCIPCTPYEKFDRWECGKPFSGMNWVNKCFYRTVCSNNHSIQLFGSHWDYKVGPTSASGGDTGTKRNCQRKRRACPGE